MPARAGWPMTMRVVTMSEPVRLLAIMEGYHEH